jgi:hypothetical protein
MSDDLIVSSQVWLKTEQKMLARIAQLVIGADPEGEMPAVDDELILQKILERALDFERPVRNGLAVLDEQLKSKEKESAFDLSDETLASLMESRAELRSLLRAMMQVVAQCYYQDERVLTALGFEARPPFPLGHVVEEGDWALLDSVRARGPLFR